VIRGIRGGGDGGFGKRGKGNLLKRSKTLVEDLTSRFWFGDPERILREIKGRGRPEKA